jgi:hypothetical protein
LRGQSFRVIRRAILLRDWEACTTGTIGRPNPDQRSVARTSAFLRPCIYPYTCRYTVRAYLRDRFLALVPLDFSYDADRLCGFSTAGRRIGWMRRNPGVRVQVEEIRPRRMDERRCPRAIHRNSDGLLAFARLPTPERTRIVARHPSLRAAHRYETRLSAD